MAKVEKVEKVELDGYEFDLLNRNIRIKCRCDGGSCPLDQTKWFKNGQKLTESENYFKTGDRLHFWNVEKEMEGKYECRVGNIKSPPAIVKTGCKYRVLKNFFDQLDLTMCQINLYACRNLRKTINYTN